MGVHSIVWCDSAINLERTIDRKAIQEMDMRIVFPMSSDDSIKLMDSSLAAKLGMHTAYFFHEDQNTIEKFRPYRIPDEEWIQKLRSLPS